MTWTWRWQPTGFAVLAVLSVTAVSSGPTSAQQPQQPAEAPSDQTRPKRLTGAEAWKSLIGNSATGRTSEGMRTEYYAADGTIKTLIDSELKTGKWRLEKERVCIQYPPSDDEDEEEEDGETCYRVTINGNYVVFIDDGGEGWRLRIVPGNPKDL